MSLLLFDEVTSESGKFDLILQSTRQTNGDSSLYFAVRSSGLLAIPVPPYPQIAQITQTNDEEAARPGSAGHVAHAFLLSVLISVM